MATVEWKTSKAKEIVLEDLRNHVVSLDKNEMTARWVWDTMYKDRIEFQGVLFSQFATNLARYRKEMLRAPKIDWKNSRARLIILEDLEKGYLPVEEEEMDAEEAWEILYKGMDEFKHVPKWQFEERLKDHREKYLKLQHRSLQEEIAFQTCVRLHPTKPHNRKGERKFYLTEAASLLRKDVEDGLHKTHTPCELQAKRSEYESWDKKIFKGRIYQEEKLQKWFNYRDDMKKEYEKALYGRENAN